MNAEQEMQLYQMVTDAMTSADNAYKAMCRKVASQEKELEELRAREAGSEGFKNLVAKLASVGVVDELQAAYLKDNVTDGNVGTFMVKLASAIEPAPIPASPYEVSNFPVGEEKKSDEDLRKLDESLMRLYRK